MKRRQVATLLTVFAVAVWLAGCGHVEPDSPWLLHVAQFSLPYGNSRLLTYNYPQLTLKHERELGSLTTRAMATPGAPSAVTPVSRKWARRRRSTKRIVGEDMLP